MLAAIYSENSADYAAIHVKQVEKPQAGPGQIVVKVHTAAINPIDDMVFKGYAKGLGWSMPLPFIVGYDFAGVVDSVHESDKSTGRFTPGERVFAVNWGTGNHQDPGTPAGGAFAEYIVIPAAKVSKIPAEVSFDQAAAVALVGTTAYQILFDAAKVTAGQKILILGGATSVGQIAIQLAKERGAWVATTASTRNLEYVAQFGADLVVNYKTQQWDELPELKDLDAVFDTTSETDSFARTRSNGVVKSDGAYVTITGPSAGFDPKGHPPLHFASLFCLINSVAVQDELVAKLANGTLKITLDETFPFTTEGVHNILKKVATGGSTGKNLLKIV